MCLIGALADFFDPDDLPAGGVLPEVLAPALPAPCRVDVALEPAFVEAGLRLTAVGAAALGVEGFFVPADLDAAASGAGLDAERPAAAAFFALEPADLVGDLPLALVPLAGAAFFAGVFFTAAFLATAVFFAPEGLVADLVALLFFAAAFFTDALEPPEFFATDFFATGFLAADVFAADFFKDALFATAFFDADLAGALLLAEAFLLPDFPPIDFLASDVVTAVFLTADFLATTILATAFLDAVFLGAALTTAVLPAACFAGAPLSAEAGADFLADDFFAACLRVVAMHLSPAVGQ